MYTFTHHWLKTHEKDQFKIQTQKTGTHQVYKRRAGPTEVGQLHTYLHAQPLSLQSTSLERE